VFGEPFVALTGDPPCAAQARLHMRPRPDRQRDVHSPLVQPPVLRDGLGQEDVLPAGDQQHRDLNPVQGRVQSQRRPELVVHVGVLEPALVPRGAPAE
jgi:hypothetical protein